MSGKLKLCQEKIKKSLFLGRMYVRWHLNRCLLAIRRFLERLYIRLKLEEVRFFFLFLFHRYSPQQFNPRLVQHNIRMLIRVKASKWLNSNRKGELIILATKWEKRLFSLKNMLLFGALRKRVEKAVYFTYVTLTLELYNPFTKRILTDFLTKKLALLTRLLDYVKQINGHFWDQSMIRQHMAAYERSSLFQAYVIRNMHLAVKRQKDPKLLQKAKEGMRKGYYPLLITMGVSGAYWMRGPNREVLGLFKPFDEEIHAPNNPIGPSYQGALGHRRTRWGCRVGESAHHEVAAYLVDEYFGFGLVPRTYYAAFTHSVFYSARENRYASLKNSKTKYGSFQEFIEGFVPLEKISLNQMHEIPLVEFQLLVMLDLIIGNTDRNIGNILLGDQTIAAIDHGLCYSDAIEHLCYWYWSYFPQGEEPLLPSLIELLENFPFDELSIKLRKKCFISLEAIQRMRERVVLFIEGIHAGLTIKNLEGLMVPKYLLPLKDRQTTLSEQAKEQVQIYQAAKG